MVLIPLFIFNFETGLEYMKFKNLLENLIVAIFIILICMPFLQMHFHIFNVPSLQEKRELALFPKITYSSIKNGSYMKAFDEYFNDNFGFKSLFVRLANYTDYYIFRKSNNSEVIIGKNDYLYYSRTKNDYDRITLSQDKIELIADNLKCVQEELKAKNIEFLFIVGPNKSTIYPEYMPGPGKKSGLSNYDKLLIELKKRNVNYLDLTHLLLKNKESYSMYYKRDTHWNMVAGVLVAQEVLERLNSEGKPRIVSLDKKNRIGDLDLMLGFSGEEEYLYPNVDFGNIGKKIPKAIWYHDSFSLNVLPYITPYFDSIITHHYGKEPFNDTFLKDVESTKLVVFEVVERDIPILSDYSFAAVCPTTYMVKVIVERPSNIPSLLTTIGPCSLDIVNNQTAQDTNPIEDKTKVKLAGWAGNVTKGTSPQEVWIELNGVNTAYLKAATKIKRPDVAAFFNKPGLVDTGWEVYADLSGLAPGNYKVQIIMLEGRAGLISDTKRTIQIK